MLQKQIVLREKESLKLLTVNDDFREKETRPESDTANDGSCQVDLECEQQTYKRW